MSCQVWNMAYSLTMFLTITLTDVWPFSGCWIRKSRLGRISSYVTLYKSKSYRRISLAIVRYNTACARLYSFINPHARWRVDKNFNSEKGYLLHSKTLSTAFGIRDKEWLWVDLVCHASPTIRIKFFWIWKDCRIPVDEVVWLSNRRLSVVCQYRASKKARVY